MGHDPAHRTPLQRGRWPGVPSAHSAHTPRPSWLRSRFYPPLEDRLSAVDGRRRNGLLCPARRMVVCGSSSHDMNAGRLVHVHCMSCFLVRRCPHLFDASSESSHALSHRPTGSRIHTLSNCGSAAAAPHAMYASDRLPLSSLLKELVSFKAAASLNPGTAALPM